MSPTPVRIWSRFECSHTDISTGCSFYLVLTGGVVYMYDGQSDRVSHVQPRYLAAEAVDDILNTWAFGYAQKAFLNIAPVVHVAITGTRWELRDTGSPNGRLLNGHPRSSVFGDMSEGELSLSLWDRTLDQCVVRRVDECCPKKDQR